MSKILLLVEGEKREKQLFDHFYKLYRERNVKIKPVEIVSFNTEIYSFYNELKKLDHNDRIDYGSIDLPLFLNEYHGLKGNKQLNSADYTEKILIFDFDPQDSKYSPNEVVELMENFSDSTTIGKLYLNYPMLESFKDIASLEDANFINTTCSKNMLFKKEYKQHINEQARKNKINNINKISQDTAEKLIDLHRQKLEFITRLSSSASEKYLNLCQEQCRKFNEEDLMWVINTSILHLYDEYGSLN